MQKHELEKYEPAEIVDRAVVRPVSRLFIAAPRSSLSLLTALILALLVAGCGSTGTHTSGRGTSPPESASDERTLALAEQAFRSGRDLEARSTFSTLSGPAHAPSVRGQAALGLGRIALRAGDAELAVRHLDEARSLLRRHALWPTAELLYGDAHIRLEHFQSGIDALVNVFPYLADDADRLRAAYLITRTRKALELDPIEPYHTLAHQGHFPEYDAVFARYVIDPAKVTVRKPPVRPPVVRNEPPAPFAVVGRASWKARPMRNNAVKNRKLSRITIHHTADQGSMVDLGSDDVAGYLRRLQAYFQNNKKYADLPYHYLIASDGKVYEGRPLSYQGAHAGDGPRNVENIGIALIGNFEKISPSDAQISSLRTLVSRLAKKHRIAKARIYPHCDIKETDCPGKVLEGTVRSLFGLDLPGEGPVLCEHDHGTDGSTCAEDASAASGVHAE